VAAPAYAVSLTAAAAEDLLAMRSLARRGLTMIHGLRTRPDRGHPLSGELAGCRSLELTHAQGGYRAVYTVRDETLEVQVIAIGPHRTVYQTARDRYQR
jgi:addiction module RelE/StbE family toxin